MADKKPPQIPLPKSWNKHVRSAMLHIVSLAQYAAVYTRGWAGDSLNGRGRLKAENNRLLQEIALLRDELRIKDARMGSIPPQRRPHYAAVERLAILELRASRLVEAAGGGEVSRHRGHDRLLDETHRRGRPSCAAASS